MNPPMQLESVGTISVSGFLLKVARQVDNGQTAKWTFLGTEQIIKLKLCVHRFVGLLDHQQVTLVKRTLALIHIPHPIHSDSEIQTILLWFVTSMQSLPGAHKK